MSALDDRKPVNDQILNDPNWVIFQGSPPPLELGETEDQFGEALKNLFARKVSDVKADWDRVFKQLNEMLSSAAQTVTDNFALESLELSLGFNAQGKLCFIAEAGVEATITMVLKRK